MKGENSILILWHSRHGGEWLQLEQLNCTLEDAIRYVKSEDRYKNYGNNGATIIQAKKLYNISEQPKETTYI